jgi:hypothetical protein
VHRFFRVAAVVLLEYLAAAAIFFGALEADAAIKGPCRGAACAVGDYFELEAYLLVGGVTVTGFVVALIVIGFRLRRARTRNLASRETSVFGSATVATAYGWAWALPASPLILWTANKVFDFITS